MADKACICNDIINISSPFCEYCSLDLYKKTEFIKKEVLYPKLELKKGNYGTSGYRQDSSVLGPIVKRCAIVALAKSIDSTSNSKTNIPKCSGIILTASHNPAKDNGVKLIDENGRMFDNKWELICDNYINNDSFKPFNESRLYKDFGIVLVFRDTRESGNNFKDDIISVLGNFNCHVVDCGKVSTPLAHFIVMKFNEIISTLNVSMTSNNFNLPSIDVIKKIYYLQNLDFYRKYCKNEKIFFDDANGVGGITVTEFLEYSSKHINGNFISIVTPQGILNKDCGAEYVKYFGVPPGITFKKKLFSVDGDMDRLIIMKGKDSNINIDNKTSNSNIEMFDGDDFIIIFLNIFFEKLQGIGNLGNVEIGVVVSDYTNFAVSEFIKRNYEEKDTTIGIDIVKAKTGIKNFIDKASKYDIGIYFEPNGHGGICFGANFTAKLEDMKKISGNKDLDFVLDASRIFFPLIGDPLPVMFLIEAGKLEKMIEKFPTKMENIKIEDSKKIQENVQKFESLNDKYSKRRCSCKTCGGKSPTSRIFIRASGTECTCYSFVIHTQTRY